MEGGTDTSHATQSNQNQASGPLVQVTFQKDPNRKAKYLESEPKALGCAQILLAVFLINAGIFDDSYWNIINIINGIFSIIAGSVAIAAQNLSLSMLKACLGLQVFTTITCAIGLLLATVGHPPFFMGYHSTRDYTLRESQNHSASSDAYSMLWNAREHYYAEGKLVLATVIAISATLSAYCCKVIQCCSPASLMPVIIVNAPTASASREDRAEESPSNR